MGNNGPRDGQGNFVPTEGVPARDAEAFRMRARGATLNEIMLALQYSSPQHVSTALKRHVSRIVKPAADEYIAVMDEQLDHMYRETMRVLEATHYRVSDGRVIYHSECDCPVIDGEHCPHWKPLKDTSPVLSSVDRLLKIQERRAKLYGLDAPVKQKIDIQNVTVKVEGADDV